MMQLPTLLVFLKYPAAGAVKTRLASAIGYERAAAYYRQWIELVLNQLQMLRGAVRVVGCFDGAAQDAFSPWDALVDAWWPQPPGNLGERLRAGFDEWRACSDRMAAIGTDCLEINAPLVKSAFEILTESDAVFGPTIDGGYYLVGTSRDLIGFFEGIPWSTAQTLAAHVSLCKQRRWSVGVLPVRRDIDTWEDWLEYNRQQRENAMERSIQQVVREKYGAVAVSDLSSNHRGVHAVAQAFGYSAEELASIPAEANMGLSCGNPTATASLRAGEVVVDLGSGGGLDVFLAAQKVGPRGRAIGVDMTPEMIERAEANAKRQGLENVEFHLAPIDKTSLADESTDCVISNCVINLAPDKQAVFREIYRILKHGGRVAVSDIAIKKELPSELRQDLLAYVGCIAGAMLISEYVSGLTAAGFAAVQVVDTGKDLNAYSQAAGQGGCCSPVMDAPTPGGSSICCPPKLAAAGGAIHGGLAALLQKYDVNEFAASVRVYAIKLAQ